MRKRIYPLNSDDKATYTDYKCYQQMTKSLIFLSIDKRWLDITFSILVVSYNTKNPIFCYINIVKTTVSKFSRNKDNEDYISQEGFYNKQLFKY